MAGGFTSFVPTEERAVDGLYTKEYLMQQLKVLLAGHGAETLVFSSVSVGASGDLRRVKEIASKMVKEWGMGDKRIFGEDSNEALERVDRQVEAIVEEAYDSCLCTLSSNLSSLNDIADVLMMQSTIDGEIVYEIVK